ncbi:hypothetical protein B0T09DRAFT_27851 [Sordaria sp. MPI-SDFR-AT-0083]|nr:hypothetical protein B0T09DRAFT_27851 [Sordaria sp. MPI-SDFR-AT-0083]
MGENRVMMASIPSVLLVSLTPFSFTPTTLLLLSVLTVFLFIYITTDGVWFVPGFGVWSGLVWSAWFGFLLFCLLLVACTGLAWFACLLLGCLGFCARLVLQLRKKEMGCVCFAHAKCCPSPGRERELRVKHKKFFFTTTTTTRNTPVTLF